MNDKITYFIYCINMLRRGEVLIINNIYHRQPPMLSNIGAARLFLFLALAISSSSIKQECQPALSYTIVDKIISKIKESDTTCPPNSHCLPSGFCACNQGFIGGCHQTAQMLSNNVEVEVKASSNDFTFFSIIPDSDAFIMLEFTLCHPQSSSNQQLLDVWVDEQGSIDNFTSNNSMGGKRSWPIQEGCIKLNTPFMRFDQQPNGEQGYFVFGIKLVEPGEVDLKLTVIIEEILLAELLLKIVIIIAGCLFVAGSIGVIYVLYKWRRRRLFLDRHKKDLERFKEYLPAFELQDAGELPDQVCSVCLGEMVRGDTLRKTPCKHYFHADCIDEWCGCSLNCPVCRGSLQEEEVMRKSDIHSESTGIRESML